jgi:O-antigen/teichoic acid export membrane protein
MQSKSHSILKSSFWSYLGVFIFLFVGLITNIVLARLLDKDNWGVFSTLIAVVSFLSAISELGLNYYITYSASKYAGKGEKEVRKNLSAPLRYKLILLLSISVLMVIFSNLLADIFHIPNGGIYFVASAVYFFFLNFFGVFIGILDGLKKFKEDSLISAGHYVLRLIFSILLVIFGFGLNGAIAGYILAVAIGTVIQYYLLRQVISISGKATESFSEMLSFGFYFGLVSIAGSFTLWTDSVMIGIFVGTTAVGVYRIAVSLSTAASSLLNGISKVTFPYFTSAEAEGKDSIKDLNKALKYGLFISIPAMFGVALSAEGVVKGFFGQQYIEASIPLIVLSYLVLDGVIVGLISSYLAAKKETRIIGHSSLIAAVLNVVLNLILIPIFGMVGAALTSIFSRLVNLGMILKWSQQRLGKTYEFSITLPLIGSIVMTAFLFLLKSFIDPTESIIHLLIFIGSGIVVYLVTEQLIGFDVLGFGKKIMKAVVPENFVKYIPISLD